VIWPQKFKSIEPALQPISPPLSSTGTNLRLGGARLPFARLAFILISLATVIFFNLGVPLYFRGYIESIDSDTLSALEGLGLSKTFYATYQPYWWYCWPLPSPLLG
jgi:hypothetical protein